MYRARCCIRARERSPGRSFSMGTSESMVEARRRHSTCGPAGCWAESRPRDDLFRANERRSTNANGTGTSFVVANSSAFRAGDVITVGTSTNLTISSVNYTANSITVATSFTWTNGAAVFAQDGSAICRGVLLDFVRLRTPENLAAASKGASMLVQGLVRTDMILGDLSAIRADTLSRLAGIRFSDEHGLS